VITEVGDMPLVVVVPRPETRDERSSGS
jgi:hypothetical protein